MGIINREGSLYMATGIDNTGLYAGRREAIGIIKAMAGQITSFDVFSGIGISAATAFASAAKSSYDFEKEFHKNMLEVATISTQVTDDMTGFMNKVMAITQEIPVKAPEAAKALYQIVSAGHDGAAGMKVLEVSAKAAVGGLTDTATAADAITTLINAYKLSAGEAANISDQLFTTVRLGKTTFGELGRSIAQAAPIAAAYGVEIDQVLAAVATLTKQGTPTAQAMTQIRAAIVGVSKYLGDGAYNGRTFQEALEMVREKAGGSEAKLREFVPEIEAVNGLLALTGQNAQEAASHLSEMGKATGATDSAFRKMLDAADNQMQLLSNNIQAALRPMGQAILKEVSEVAKAFNEAFENGDVKEAMKILGDLIVIVTGAFVGYKGAVIASTVANNAHTKAILISRLASIQHITTTQLLTNAIKAQTASMLKNIAALATNPYVLAAAAITTLGAVIYQNAIKATEAEKAQSRLNDAIKESEKGALSEQRELARLKGELSATAKGTEEYNKIRDEIVSKYGKYDKNLKDEIDRVGLLDTTYQNLTKSIQQSFDARQYDRFKQEQGTALNDVMSDNLSSMYDKLVGKWGDEIGAKYYTEIKNALMAGEEIPQHLNNVVSNMYGIWAQSLHGYIKNIREAQKATEDADKKARVKFGIEDGAGNSSEGNNGKDGKGNGTKKELSSVSEEIKTVTANISTLKQELSDLRSGKTTAEAGKTVQSAIEEKAKELAAAESALATLTGKDKTSDKKYEDEQKKLLEQQKAIFLQLLDLRLQNQQAEIDLMEEGSEKKIAQINLDYDKEIAAILAKEKEWKEAQGGKLTDEQNVEIGKSLAQSYVKREKATGLVSSEQLELEKRMMNEYMAAYGDYQEKRLAITELYNEKISKATTEGERLSLGEELKKALATADDEAQKKTSVITRLFADMSKKTVKDIRAIADEAEDFLSFLENGEYSSDDAFGITKEQFDILRKSPDQLKSIKDEIENVRREADQCETSFNKVSEGLKKVFSAGDDAKALKEGLEDINQGMNEIIQSGQFLSDTLSKLGDSFGGAFTGIADGLNVAMDTMSSAMDGAKAGAMFGPIGSSAGAAIGVVSSLASAITKIHDKKNEKRIERLQSQIETLDKSYEALDKAINKAYSNDASNLIDQQNKLLEQQKVLIQNQIKEEQDKKKTDNDRIKDWQNQIDEINNVIADNKEAGKDAIFGSDIKSAIDDFANAYAEAWSAGEDKAESAKDLVKKMIKGMIMESIKAAASDPMKAIREKLLEFWADDYISDWEQDYLDKEAQKLTDMIDGKFGWADKYIKDEEKKMDGVSGQLQAAMTEGTATQIVGLWNSTAIDMREMKLISIKTGETVSSILSDVREIVKQNVLIEQNTRRGADNTDGLIDELQAGFGSLDRRLSNIERNTKTSNSRG